ncbi:unnamed protein product [Leptosia nina]|uniref:Peptidase S1 domain-containing protein n=1 Tax=Leptosia nina TaxID=320188 RepID=A0AAV1JTB8_9NEOP
MGGLIIDLTSGQQSVCGSSLLSHNRALTAAQCWRSRRHEGKRLLVVLGSLRLFSGGRRVETNKVLVHENYDKILLHNDIAVIILPTILFTNSIRPINIAEGNQSYVGDTATAVGFGRTGHSEEDGISRQQQLRFVGLQVISTNECARVYGLNYVTNSTLCVSGSGGRSICGGDQGGPLIFNHQVIGVTSINAATGCEKNRPTGFTRVPSFHSWIRANM